MDNICSKFQFRGWIVPIPALNTSDGKYAHSFVSYAIIFSPNYSHFPRKQCYEQFLREINASTMTLSKSHSHGETFCSIITLQTLLNVSTFTIASQSSVYSLQITIYIIVFHWGTILRSLKKNLITFLCPPWPISTKFSNHE